MSSLCHQARAAEIHVPNADVQALIDAIDSANASPEADVIHLAENGYYALTAVHNFDPVGGGANGLPRITGELTIHGHGARILRGEEDIEAPEFRILHIESDGILRIDNLSTYYGVAPLGGGIQNGGTLEATRVFVYANTAWFSGGGIWSASGSRLVLDSCTVNGNLTYPDLEYGYGAGVAGRGNTTIVDSEISANRGATYGGGVFLEDPGAVLVLIRTEVFGNSAQYGGGIAAWSGDVTIEQSSIRQNTARDGSGLWGPVRIVNSTVSGNVLTTDVEDSVQSAVHVRGQSSIINSTIAGNQDELVASVGVLVKSSASLAMTNSIISDHASGDCVNEGAFADDGHNIIGDGSCISDPTSFAADPMLGPLTRNGGPTMTHALLAGSPALNAGDCAGGTIVVDQRGFPRPQGAACDIGAHEQCCSSNAVLIPDGDVEALIAAIYCANESHGPDVLELADRGQYTLMSAAPFTFGGPLPYESVNANGLPAIAGELRIEGNGATIQRGEEAPAFRILEVMPEGRLTLSNLTLRNGRSLGHGGGVRNEGVLQATRVSFSNSRVSDSWAFSGGQGGALFNSGEATLNEVLITGNIVESGDGAGICNEIGATLTMHGGAVIGNVAESGQGAGIMNRGEASIFGVTVSGNLNRNARLVNFRGGAGIYNRSQLYLYDAIIRDNVVNPGANPGVRYLTGTGIHTSGLSILIKITTHVERTIISDNGGHPGALGIYVGNGGCFITGCTVVGNAGGGIYARGSSIVTNSTVSENGGDGVWAERMSLENCTVVANSLNGLAHIGNSLGWSLVFQNTIVASNGVDVWPYGGVRDYGFNIVGDGSRITHPTSFAADPMLGPLADNGGPTPTHALLAGSPALDAGDCVGGTITEDQRGMRRPQGSACDIGAYERIDPMPFGDVNLDGQVDRTDFAQLIQCLEGPEPVSLSHCLDADVTGDGTVDLRDVAEFEAAMAVGP